MKERTKFIIEQAKEVFGSKIREVRINEGRREDEIKYYSVTFFDTNEVGMARIVEAWDWLDAMAQVKEEYPECKISRITDSITDTHYYGKRNTNEDSRVAKMCTLIDGVLYISE